MVRVDRGQDLSEDRPDIPAPWLVVHVTHYIPPIRLSILIGECVHNMRSAIDNLVCGLALTLKSTSKCRCLAFPLLKDQQDWDDNADKKLKGIPPAAKDAIRQLSRGPRRYRPIR